MPGMSSRALHLQPRVLSLSGIIARANGGRGDLAASRRRGSRPCSTAASRLDCRRLSRASMLDATYSIERLDIVTQPRPPGAMRERRALSALTARVRAASCVQSDSVRLKGEVSFPFSPWPGQELSTCAIVAHGLGGREWRAVAPSRVAVTSPDLRCRRSAIVHY